MSLNPKKQAQRAKRKMLTDGQGARKKKTAHRHISPSHKRSFRDLKKRK